MILRWAYGLALTVTLLLKMASFVTKVIQSVLVWNSKVICLSLNFENFQQYLEISFRLKVNLQQTL